MLWNCPQGFCVVPRAQAVFVLAYAAALVALVEMRPLGLDEILQLLGTRDQTFDRALVWIRQNPGASPLGYLGQWFILKLFGYSVTTARLLSIGASVLSCIAIRALAKALRLGRPGIAVLLFALLPLQLRYALEARPYSPALLCVLLSTLAAVRLSRQPCARTCIVYSLSVAAGLYTQSYTAFVALGHILWFVSWDGTRQRTRQKFAAWALTAAGLAFAPWFLATSGSWHESIGRTGLVFTLSAKTGLSLLREQCGGGYALSISTAVVALIGALYSATTCKPRVLMMCCTVLPVFGALAGDAAFGYFFAIRQVMFMLPGLILLAAEGLRVIHQRSPAAAAIVLAAIVLLMVVHDIRLFSGPRENWAVAASALRRSAAGCVAVTPAASIALYEFFEPELHFKQCSSLNEVGQIALAVTPYASPSEDARILSLYHRRGFRVVRVEFIGRTWIRMLESSNQGLQISGNER